MMDFVAYSPINIPEEAWGWLLGISAIILTILGILAILALVLLVFAIWCLTKFPRGKAGKIICLCVVIFFFPFGSPLYLLAYFLRDRNDQGSLNYEVDATEPPDDESENCAEDSWGSEKVWGEKIRS